MVRRWRSVGVEWQRDGGGGAVVEVLRDSSSPAALATTPSARVVQPRSVCGGGRCWCGTSRVDTPVVDSADASPPSPLACAAAVGSAAVLRHGSAGRPWLAPVHARTHSPRSPWSIQRRGMRPPLRQPPSSNRAAPSSKAAA